MLARSKMVGALETGEGEQVPPPRQPLPPWRYPHGPQHGEILEKSRIRLSIGYTPGTAAPLISPRTAHAPGEGAGEERRRRGRGGGGRQKCMDIPTEGAGGVGGPVEVYRYPPARRGRGGDASRSVRASPAAGAGGVGVPEKNASVFPLQGYRQRTLPREATYRPPEPLFVRGIYFYRPPAQPAWDRR